MLYFRLVKMMRIIAISIILCHICSSFTFSDPLDSKENIPSLTQCSKYDFEEKVLEKLVRMEHKMEMYEIKMKKFEESVMFKLNDFNESESQRRYTMKSLILQTFKEEKSALNSSVKSLILDTFTEEKSLLNSSVQSLIQDTFKIEKNLFNSSLVNVTEDVMIKSEKNLNKLTSQFNQLRKGKIY